jgi:hypothetical protein
VIYLLRESRHLGFGLALDSLRATSIDVDGRSLADFLMIKSLGLEGLPDEFRWVYGFVEPFVLRKMDPANFVCLSRWGGVGLGAFKLGEWHKRPRENLLKKLGVKVEFSEEVTLSESKGSRNLDAVTDEQHIRIIEGYMAEGLSMAKVGAVVGRSPSTVHSELTRHNEALERSGWCAICKRMGSQLFKTKAER